MSSFKPQLMALLVLATGCASAALNDIPGQPTPSPTPGGLTEVDLLLSPSGGAYPKQVVRVTAADTLGPVDIQLHEGFEVSGYVQTVGSPPQPLDEGAQVTAIGTGETSQRVQATTSAAPGTGEYALALPPGTYDFVVTPNASTPTRPVMIFPDREIIEPQVLDLTLPDPISVTGTVKDDLGSEVGIGFRVTAIDGTGAGQVQAALTDQNGMYELALPAPGTYTFRITPPETSPSFPVVGISNVDVQGDGVLDYDYPTGFPVAGLVNISGTANVADLTPPLPDFDAMTVAVEGTLQVSQRPDEIFTYSAEAPVTAVNMGTEGDFSVSVLPGGIYTVKLFPQLPDPYGHRIIPDVQVDDADVQLSTEQARLPKKVELFGQITDSNGGVVNGVRVVYNSVDSSGFLFLDQTDASGFYSLEINPAPYDVQIVPPADEGLLRLESSQVVDGTLENPVNQMLGIGTLLDGQITDPTGAPISGVDVSVLNTSTGARIGADKATTDENGAYTVTIPPLSAN